MDHDTEKPGQFWLYEGIPDYIDINIESTSLDQGGYIVAMQLENGTIRLAATHAPAKYVTAWRHNVRRYGVPDIIRVWVSKPILRYEAVKRALASKLSSYRHDNLDAYQIDVNDFTTQAQDMFTAAGVQRNQVRP